MTVQTKKIIFLVICFCGININCRQKSLSPVQVQNNPTEPILKLPTEGSPLATPHPSKEIAATEFWEVQMSKVKFTRDFMPTNIPPPSTTTVNLLIKNKSAFNLSLKYEGWVKDLHIGKAYPITLLIASLKSGGERVKLKSKEKLLVQLISRDGPAFAQMSELVLGIKVSDSKNNWVELYSAPKGIWGPQ